MVNESDARRRRSRAALHSAVLEMAAEQDPGRISVSALAERAGVHRSTVYEHAETPMHILESALLSELDALRDKHLRDVPLDQVSRALREVTIELFEHVEKHRAVYERLEAAPGASLHAFLGPQFEESTRMLLRQHSLSLPPIPAAVDSGLRDDAAVRYIAAGSVGVIEAWLADPGRPATDEIARILDQLQPAWWPRGL